MTLPFRVGKLTLVERLAEGGSGTVYLTEKDSLERQLAVKMIHAMDLSEVRLKRFTREAKLTAKLKHPHIVPALDFGFESGRPWLSMPYIEGCSLDNPNIFEFAADAITNTRGKFDWIAKIGAEAASALHAAHSAGVIHRDIKPANLILDNNGHTWVTDFGTAKQFESDEDLTESVSLLGTPLYMAPEQMRGTAGTRSDIYGLGATLYDLALQHPRKKKASLRKQFNSLRLVDIRESNPNIPKELAEIIMTACAFEPENRYASADVLQHALNQYLRRRTDSDRRQRPPSGKRRNVIVTTLVALTLMTLLTIFVSRRDQQTAILPSRQPIATSGVDSTSEFQTVYEIDENSTHIATLAKPNSPDRFTLHGPDAEYFDVIENQNLVFAAPPDFEFPKDLDANNRYLVSVANGKERKSIDFEIYVQDINEPPEFVNLSRDSVPRLDIANGQRNVDLSRLGIVDPEGRACCVRIVGGEHARKFFAPCRGATIFPDRTTATGPGLSRIKIEILDDVARFSGFTLKANSGGEHWVESLESNRSQKLEEGALANASRHLGIASPNGRTVYWLEEDTNGNARFMKVLLRNAIQLTQPICLVENAALPVVPQAMVTFDGIDFAVIGFPRTSPPENECEIHWLRFKDGKFSNCGPTTRCKVRGQVVAAFKESTRTNAFFLLSATETQCYLYATTFDLATYENLGQFKLGDQSLSVNTVGACNWPIEIADKANRLAFDLELMVHDPQDSVPSRSLAGGESVELVIHNASDEKLELRWRNFDGERISYGFIEPRQTSQQQTYTLHAWEMVDTNGKLWDEFFAWNNLKWTVPATAKERPGQAVAVPAQPEDSDWNK